MNPGLIHTIGLIASLVGLICGLFFFVYSVRYYLFSIFILLKDQQALDKAQTEKNNLGLGFTFSSIDMLAHQLKKNRACIRSAKVIGFKKKRVHTELLLNQIDQNNLGFSRQGIDMSDQTIFQRVTNRLSDIFWEIKRTKDQIIVHPARIGIRKRLHQMLIMIMKKSNYEYLSTLFLLWFSALGKLLTGNASWTMSEYSILPQTAKTLSNYTFSSRELKFSRHAVKLGQKAQQLYRKINLDSLGLIDDPIHQPFVSIHLAFYNEENVAERVIEACLGQDYQRYEIIIADDSTDNTPQILKKYAHNKRIKIIHRGTRDGYKGGALKEAIKQTNPAAEFVIVYDADFVPPPGSIKSFLKEFFVQNGNTFSLEKEKSLAAVQGYQWHILNKDENFVTAGIRFGFAGGYMIERTAQQYLGAMKMIAGSVFIIRRDVLEKYTWQIENGYTSIVEDWNLTIRMYIDGWKIGYTPDIKVPSECVNSLNKLARQQIRWAEGHTWNVKKYFWQVMFSQHMTLIEKIEFLFYSPFYMQAFLFIVGTVGWVIGELIFHIKVPGWTATLGWSLVFTNLMALPVMCISGLVLERGEDRDYNFLPFLTYIYYIIPHLAYASIKGLISPYEGAWVRTFKTGSVTDAIMESQMAGSSLELIDANVNLLNKSLDKTAKQFEANQKLYKYEKKQTDELKKGRFWLELKRVPRLGLAIILLLAIIVGSIGYLATTEVTAAANDIAYLNNPNYLSPTAASSPKTVKFNLQNPSYTWYSDPCPTGNTAGGIAAGNYSTTLKLVSKPQTNKTYSFTVGHVNSSGGDYQYITSTNYVINQNTPSTLTFNIGNGPAISCDVQHKRKLVYTITYLSSEGNCDAASKCSSVTCPTNVSVNTQTDSSKNILAALPKIDIVGTASASAPCPSQSCVNLSNMSFYIPLQSSTSGTYPSKGTSVDQVTLTTSSPTSTGYLDVNLVFNNLPASLINPHLHLNFTDLDLHLQTINPNTSPRATLLETFTLKDINNNVLTTLDSSYPDTGSFNWDYNLPNSLITGNSLTLKTHFTAKVALTLGSKITLQNTLDGMNSISLCGDNYTCATGKIVPVVKCIDDLGNRSYKAHFSYNNPNTIPVYIPIGYRNTFLPTPADRGQTQNFLVGSIDDAFQVTFNSSSLAWYLTSPSGQSASATATSNSPRCTTNCCCDDLVIEYNNGISILCCPHIIVPEATLLLGLPALLGWWHSRKKRNKRNKPL